MSDDAPTVDVPAMLDALGIVADERAGELWAPCPHPEHSERTPSWSIGTAGGHHCFGCKWQGGPRELVRQAVGLKTLSAAHRWLQDKGLYSAGNVPLAVELHVTRPATQQQMTLPPGAYNFGTLDQWVTPARRYAQRRGITATQAARWRLMTSGAGYFANRLLLPTYGRQGALLHVTGRTFLRRGSPRYLTARKSDGASTAAVFGEEWWPEDPSVSALVLCEGELNALACERVGARYVGALGGSSLDKQQLMKLSRFGRVILATDVDTAGTKIAAQLKATLLRWRSVDRVQFPDKRDCNDLERDEPELLTRLLWGKGQAAIVQTH